MTVNKKNNTAKKKQKESTTDVYVLDVYSLSGKNIDKFKLDPSVFNAEVKKGLLHQVVRMYLANRRQGNASTKEKGEVRGGGKKPWKQKGTGRARAGSIRSPIWKGGGTIFGPHPRDYSYDLPKKLKRVALISGLSAKAKDNEIVILEKDPEIKTPKTKDMVNILKAIKLYGKKVLYVYSKNDDALYCSGRNIKNLSMRLCGDLNTYDILSHGILLLSRDSHDVLVKRLKR